MEKLKEVLHIKEKHHDKPHEKSDAENGGLGSDNEGVRVYKEDDEGDHAVGQVQTVLPNRRPLHEENTGESPVKAKRIFSGKHEMEEKPTVTVKHDASESYAGKAEQQPSPRSAREHLNEPDEARMMGNQEIVKDSVTEGREVRDEPILEGTKTFTETELMGMPSGSVTMHGTTPHSKITATATETQNKKTITVTEHVQKKSLFGSTPYGTAEEHK